MHGSGNDSLPTTGHRGRAGVGGSGGQGSARETLFVDLKRLTGRLPGTSSLSDPPLPQLSVKFAGAKSSAAGDTRQELET